MSLVELNKFNTMIFSWEFLQFDLDAVSNWWCWWCPLFSPSLIFRYSSMPYTRYYLEKELVCLFSTTKKHKIIQPKHEGKHLHLPPKCSPNHLKYSDQRTPWDTAKWFVLCRCFDLFPVFLERLFSKPQNWRGGGETTVKTFPHPFPFEKIRLGVGNWEWFSSIFLKLGTSGKKTMSFQQSWTLWGSFLGRLGNFLGYFSLKWCNISLNTFKVKGYPPGTRTPQKLLVQASLSVNIKVIFSLESEQNGPTHSEKKCRKSSDFIFFCVIKGNSVSFFRK